MKIIAINGSLRARSSNAALLRAAARVAPPGVEVVCYEGLGDRVPGSLKNLLDWLVSTGELVDMPVALLNASPSGGQYAQSALLETLRTMNWRVAEGACLIEPFVGRRIVDELTDGEAIEVLRRAMRVFSNQWDK